MEMKIEERIQKTKKDIELSTADLKALRIRQEADLLAERDTMQVEAEIQNTTRKIARRQVLMKGLERKRVEAKKLKEEEEKAERVAKLKTRAKEIEEEAQKYVDELKELSQRGSFLTSEIRKMKIEATQIRAESQQLGTPIVPTLPKEVLLRGF